MSTSHTAYSLLAPNTGTATTHILLLMWHCSTCRRTARYRLPFQTRTQSLEAFFFEVFMVQSKRLRLQILFINHMYHLGMIALYCVTAAAISHGFMARKCLYYVFE